MKEKRKNLTAEEVSEAVKEEITRQREKHTADMQVIADKVYRKLTTGNFTVQRGRIHVNMWRIGMLDHTDRSTLMDMFRQYNLYCREINYGVLWHDFEFEVVE